MTRVEALDDVYWTQPLLLPFLTLHLTGLSDLFTPPRPLANETSNHSGPQYSTLSHGVLYCLQDTNASGTCITLCPHSMRTQAARRRICTCPGCYHTQAWNTQSLLNNLNEPSIFIFENPKRKLVPPLNEDHEPGEFSVLHILELPSTGKPAR